MILRRCSLVSPLLKASATAGSSTQFMTSSFPCSQALEAEGEVIVLNTSASLSEKQNSANHIEDPMYSHVHSDIFPLLRTHADSKIWKRTLLRAKSRINDI